MSDAVLTLGAADPIAHVVNHAWLRASDGTWLWSSAQTMLVISGAIVILAGMFVASKVNTGPESEGNKRYLTKNLFASTVEVICVYLRSNTVKPLLHGRTDRFMPFLWTIFFFILVNNLLGLVPILDLHALLTPAIVHGEHRAIIGGTATQSIAVTGALALIGAIAINAAGLKELGLMGYLKHLTGGAPVALWPLLVPIEVAGTVIKPVALAIRLFANMTAGHILIAVLAGFVGTGAGMMFRDQDPNLLLGGTVSLVSFVAQVPIMFLELFVAFLQAFVFMFLVAVFISLLSHHDDHDHAHDHGHTHGAHA